MSKLIKCNKFHVSVNFTLWLWILKLPDVFEVMNSEHALAQQYTQGYNKPRESKVLFSHHNSKMQLCWHISINASIFKHITRLFIFKSRYHFKSWVNCPSYCLDCDVLVSVTQPVVHVLSQLGHHSRGSVGQCYQPMIHGLTRFVAKI